MRQKDSHPRATRPAPSATFRAVDAITRAAEAAGWPSKQAFHLAFCLVIAGTPIDEAKALFSPQRRVQ